LLITRELPPVPNKTRFRELYKEGRLSTKNNGPGVRRMLFPVERLLVEEEVGAESGGSGQIGGLDAEHVADLQVNSLTVKKASTKH
jgi:hypothetical protein